MHYYSRVFVHYSPLSPCPRPYEFVFFILNDMKFHNNILNWGSPFIYIAWYSVTTLKPTSFSLGNTLLSFISVLSEISIIWILYFLKYKLRNHLPFFVFRFCKVARQTWANGKSCLSWTRSYTSPPTPLVTRRQNMPPTPSVYGLISCLIMAKQDVKFPRGLPDHQHRLPQAH